MSVVHFILTRGELIPQYRRAIVSATVHRVPITLWYLEDEPDVRGLPVSTRRVVVDAPETSAIHPAHVWDVLAFKIGYEEGGLVLGLDTISVRPALPLLSDHDFVCSRDFSEAEMAEGITISPYTMTFVARQGAPVVREMYEEALRRALYEEETWGFTGPEVLREFVDVREEARSVPYPALCGWNSRWIWKFYMGVEEPSPEVCVIHLFSQGEPELWRGDWQGFRDKHPAIAQQHLPTNEDLLACPNILRWTPDLGRDVYLRPNSSDEQTWTDTFIHRYHVPPEQIEPQTVLDLGANIGLTAAHYEALWPEARVWAIEMDAESLRMCEVNFYGLIFQAAVGVSTGNASYAKGAWAAANTLLVPGSTQVNVIALSQLIDGIGGYVDFVKMDIEGTEWELFDHPEGWAERVGSLLVELHGVTPSEILVRRAMNALSASGFEVTRHVVHPHAVWAKR